MTEFPRSFDFVVALGFLFAVAGAAAGQPQSTGDNWLATAGVFPDSALGSAVQSNRFLDLRTEAVAGRMKVLWTPETTSAPAQQVLVRASAGPPGHWPARDWRSLAMNQRASRWEASLPVEDVDEPIIYFLQAVGGGQTNLSPMRLVTPRMAGLEEPTRPFWSFLEGFEEGMESWRLIESGGPAAALRVEAQARTGRGALVVPAPKKGHSLTLATTRLRGWQLQQRNASGVRIWARTRAGSAALRFALVSHAFTRDQTANSWPESISVTDQWQKVDLVFSELGAPLLGSVDLFTIQFVAEGPTELLLDDLQLLGPWRTEP